MIGSTIALVAVCALTTLAQQPQSGTGQRETPPQFDGPPPGDGPDFGGPPPFGPGGFNGAPPFGPGGFGPGGGPGGMNRETKLVKDFDKDGDGRLNTGERKAARESLKNQGGGRGFGGPGGRRGGFGPGAQSSEPTKPGPKMSPTDVKPIVSAPIYDPLTVRTFFLEFENDDWEKELADFNNTDVEVPAKVIVDGKAYPDVGVHFRGATSFMFAGEGRKRPLNLSFDFVHKDQNLGGYRTFNLLNAHEDPSYLRAMLYLEIARDYLPAAKANFVRVVINGEYWGIYTSAQQFNKDFVQDWFGTTKGARWKVPGSPGGRGGLEYLGDDAADYRQTYTIKTKDSPEVWADFIKMCRALNETDVEQLPDAVEPLLDVDGALRFLAIEVALVNGDGYWTRASDFNIYEDKSGKFHILPHDVNEAMSSSGGPGFGGPGGPGRGGRRDGGAFGPNAGRAAGTNTATRPNFGSGFRGGPGGGGIELDPLVGLTDSSKPLRSRLLAVPEYRARYLGYVRDIAERWLEWDKQLGPLARKYHDLIADDVKMETRKLVTQEAFDQSLGNTSTTSNPQAGEDRGPGGAKMSLRDFAQRRRAFLLNHAEVKAAKLPAAR